MAKQGPLFGQQVANKYRLGELLGSGGMGAVYKAHDTRLNRPVAMKVMSPAGPLSAAELQHFTQLFQAEALRLASLKHPGIPHIYDHFEESECWFLAMEFIEGETLKDYLERRGGQLPMDEVLNIGLQLADVLNYLHLRQPPIIFRDLKPANVMIAPDGQVFLIDFGIARLFTPGKSQDTFVFLSQGYAAPEQYGTAQTTVLSDIYSLGATLHHLLSGTHPASSPFLFAPLSIQQPPQLATLIAHMVSIDSAHRPASMAEVKEALQRMRDQTAAGPLTSAVPAPTTPVLSAFSPTMQPPQPAMATMPLAGASPPLAGSSSGSPFPPAGRSTPSARGAPPIGTTLVTWRPQAGALALAWSPDGQRIASGTSLIKRIEIHDAITGKILIEPSDFLFDSSSGYWRYSERGDSWNPALIDSSWAIEAIVWSPDGKYVVTCNSIKKYSYDNSGVMIWEASEQATGKFWHRKRELAAADIAPYGLSSSYEILWSPDVSKVAVFDWGRLTVSTIIVPRLRGRELLVHRSLDYEPPRGDAAAWDSMHINGGDAVAWSPDSTRIAWGTGNEIPVWDVSRQGGQHLLTYREHRSPIVAVSWSPDGRQITSRSADGSGLVWDAGSGRTVATFIAPAEEKRYWHSLKETIKESSAISPDGALKAVPTDDGIELRTVARDEMIFVYRGHFSDTTAEHWSPHVHALVWSPDGTRVAFARFDGRIYVWQAV
jgi:eukaryotic-like serine/threonine-protein kinase